MTEQALEVLHWQGEELSLKQFPLEAWFSLGGERPALRPGSTALKRGYVGRWEIANGRLYLVDVGARLWDGQAATLNDFFPEARGPVFCHWYSGVLRAPHGQMYTTEYEFVWERQWVFNIERGVVTDARDVENDLSRVF